MNDHEQANDPWDVPEPSAPTPPSSPPPSAPPIPPVAPVAPVPSAPVAPTVPSMPTNPASPAPAATPNVNMGPQLRDRIVVLGRRRSGKTIYLARLYEMLWNSPKADLHMRALDGNSHLSLMRIVDSLKNGEWPAATGGNTYSTFELSYEGETFPLVMLDYPGEVFRRAFVEGIDAPDTKDLVEHVDRALGILCLIDPGNILDGSIEAFTDDEFGMVQALDRVRRSRDGENISIALVLTKCDVHGKRIKRLGGTRAFVRDRLLNVLRIAGRLRYWATAAVRSTKDAREQDVPDLRRPAEGVMEPILWVVEQIIVNRKRVQVQETRRVQEEHKRAHYEAEQKARLQQSRQHRRFWILFIILASLFGAIAIAIAVIFSIQQSKAPDQAPETPPVVERR